MKFYYLIFLLAMASCGAQQEDFRNVLELEGEWQFALDNNDVGIEKQWYLKNLDDVVQLPGTTDSNKKGILNIDTTLAHLNRVYKYEGAAWYKRKITIPGNFEGKHIKLFLERTKPSQIWIDSTMVGSSNLLQSPQTFDVSQYLSPGEHHISVRVNNDLDLTPYGNVHIYSDDSQTNWNGILGEIHLEASPKTHISNLQVYPDIDNEKINVMLEVENPLKHEQLEITLKVHKNFRGETTELPEKKFNIKYEPKMNLDYFFAEPVSLWDEYEQPIYFLTAVVSGGNEKDALKVPFGMRKFKAEGTQFKINGRTTFLRGKHDAAVFPLTGYAPINVEDWKRVYRIAKTYGINHYRFHSYTPPEAAFTAADEEGIYLQAELPFWGGMESDTIAEMQKQEGLAMLKAYANHPSFVMFSPGNEIWSGHENVKKNMLALKEYDDRPLYTMGSNNNIGYLPPAGYSEFFVGSRTPFDGDSILSHTRLTHAFADSKNGGILNTQIPSTDFDYSYAVNQVDIPLISHEIGQYQIYPNYDEIDKYTGVLRAWNLEKFRESLIASGMKNMDSIFQKASGAWSAICYKAEMEAALRTEGMAGFQLLDLQDFPGQGTALVGILDSFMDSKEVITPEKWRQSCNDVVVLLEFSKYTWTNEENFEAEIVVANYSNTGIAGDLNWRILKEDGTTVKKGIFPDLKIPNGKLFHVGDISTTLSSIAKAEKLTVEVRISNTEYQNSYPMWVYPSSTAVEIPTGITIPEVLNDRIFEQLKNGAKMLYFPQTVDVKENSFRGHFPPEFWNYGMFKGISENVDKPVSPGTLGILTNPSHPIFSSFPTDFHTNWQWFSIIKESNSIILDNTDSDYLPIVHIIDNLERNHKLGLIFEFKVGKGKLLVCMSQLNKLKGTPEADQLYKSILDYMSSDNFNPSYEINVETLAELLN
ncbi:sugar-binding domain-containing protein [Salinimicrobium sp. WS361]|uniref:sugar-binding domain-containing protein n=1 Tax=Salinimicrobium sp. WS361 TaxID=3425123 RepID=UPI003D6F4B9A